MKKFISVILSIAMLGGIVVVNASENVSENVSQNPIAFMDCFEPMPIVENLSSDCWGAALTGPRDQGNGLEDRKIENYAYWDGGIIKNEENGKYYMFASRWDEEKGHGGWKNSVGIYAVSDNFYGPYVEQEGLLWPDNRNGAGHNVYPFKLKDGDPNGKYAIINSDNGRPGDIFVADSLDGPWTYCTSITSNIEGGGFVAINVAVLLRPDGKYQALGRYGDIAIADDLKGPWRVAVDSLWEQVPGLPYRDADGGNRLEDPTMWYSNGMYHIVVNHWNMRKAFYMTSKDGITNWQLHSGSAYEPDADFLRYTDGTVNNWNKIERPYAYIEDGELKAFTFAVIDSPKEEDKGGDLHGSKIIVVPFNSEKLEKVLNEKCVYFEREGLVPTSDVNVQSWKEENEYNYGANTEMRMQVNNLDTAFGVFGENIGGGTSDDSKISYLKYDLSGVDLENAERATLSLIYKHRKVGSGKTDRVRVALADTTWNEGVGSDIHGKDTIESDITWAEKAKIDDSEICVSKEFSTDEKYQIIEVDVTKLIKSLDKNAKVVSFALCNETQGNTLAFYTKEFGTEYSAKLDIKEKGEVTKMAEDAMYYLHYDKPADITSYDAWEKLSLPVGNGNIGGNVFGGIGKERITLNEKTMWKGGPSDLRPNYNGGNNIDNGKYGETLKEVQRLFREGKDSEASSLCNQLIGDKDGYGGYQQFGNLYLDFGEVNDVVNYRRGLDIEKGIADVSYDVDNVHYEREIFTSYIDNVMVVRLTSKGGNLDLTVALEPENGGAAPRKSTITASGNTILLTGELDDNQLKYSGYLKVLGKGVSKEGEKLRIKGTDEAIIILSMGTDYALDYPAYRTGESQSELNKRVKKCVENAAKKSYDTLKSEHIEDVTGLMGRVNLDLGQINPSLTTDKLLAGYKANTLTKEEKAYLEVLLFQYGRYLLVSSSRENNILPANLQGIWVGKNGSAWNSDYHINVNLQMNYWHAYNTNLKECAIPMIEYVEGLREPGRKTANIYFGVESTKENPENGFTANTQSTPYGWTAPGWQFDWGWSPASVPWMLQNVWEYYEYTLDEEFLKETIYPIMKEEAVFYSQILIEDEEGRLISTPAYSPEHGPRTNGNTYEQTLIWQLFTDTIKAGEIIGEDEELLDEWRNILSRLRQPIEIGTDGQVKEWYEETALGSMKWSDAYGHRHLSHLLGLYPGDLISVDTPEWFEAARVSLDARVDASTGWAMGQRINTWARLGDGEHMYYLVQTLIKTGILNNLWDTHPPFQIDGNFGYTAGVAEALMQSNMGYINILPAIPAAWSTGKVEGLIARGNYEVGIKWDNKVPHTVTINANETDKCIVNMTMGREFSVTDSKGNNVEYENVKTNRIAFDAKAGETYTIKNSKVIEPVEYVGGKDEVIDSNDNRVKYEGNWSLFTENDHYMSTNNCSWTKNSSASLTFYGTGIELYSVAKPNYNGVYVFIDGEKMEGYYSVNSDKKTENYLVFSKKDLPKGEHTIEVVVMDEVVTDVKDLSISIDYFKVYAGIEGSVITVIEEGNSYVTVQTEFEKETECIFYFAVYENNKLKYVKLDKEAVPQGIWNFNFDLDLDGKTVKVFVWDKESNKLIQYEKQ